MHTITLDEAKKNARQYQAEQQVEVPSKEPLLHRFFDWIVATRDRIELRKLRGDEKALVTQIEAIPAELEREMRKADRHCTMAIAAAELHRDKRIRWLKSTAPVTLINKEHDLRETRVRISELESKS